MMAIVVIENGGGATRVCELTHISWPTAGILLLGFFFFFWFVFVFVCLFFFLFICWFVFLFWGVVLVRFIRGWFEWGWGGV